MSTKAAGPSLRRISPGGRMLRQAVAGLLRPDGSLQVTAVSESALRGLRAIFPPDEAERVGIELMPIGDLISRVARLAGVRTLRVAQSGHTVAAIAEACRRLPSESPLTNCATLPGIHKALAETLGTLRAYGFDATRLDVIAEDAEPYLASKLRSLGFLLRESDESLRALGREHVTTWLERTVATDPNECDDGGQLAIVVGGPLEPALADWIKWLARTRATVTLIGELHPGISNMYGDLSGYFPETEPKVAIEPNSITARLFLPGSSPITGLDLEVLAAPDLLSECEWAIRDCQAALASGAEPGQVAVIAREIRTYAPALIAASRRLGVRLDLPWRAPLLSNRLIAFFLELLSALGSADVRSLIRPLRSPYSGLGLETQAKLEGVLRELRRTGSGAWEVLESVAPALTDEIPWLEPVLEWRTEAMSRPAEPWEWFGRIMTLADLIPWQDAAVEFPEFIERDARAQTAMQRTVTERASLAKIRRTAAMPYAAAIEWLREAWDEADYSVPSRGGAIRVVSNGSELGECSTLAVLGMLEGILPRRPREDPILGDLERDELSKLAALPIPLPTSRDEAIREREEFVRICGSASERLILSYRLATGERNNIPTAYIDEAERLCESKVRTTYSRTQFTPDAPTLPSDVSIAAALKVRQRFSETDFVSAAVRRKFAWSVDRPFEPQQLRRATQCAFRFFARDQLGLRPSRRLQLWNRLLELPITADLALQADRPGAEGALLKALEELVDTQVGRLADWELAVIRSGGRRMISDWVDREFRARDLWPRQNIRVKVPIGSPGVLNKAASDVTLAGTVPALGRMGSYALARLYESNAPDRLGPDSTDANFLYFALWSVIAQGDAGATAIEVETLGRARRLFVLPRLPGPLPSDRDLGLFAAAVTSVEEDVWKSVKSRARGLVRIAVDRARNGDVTPNPSMDHCPGCGFGELCRRSADFGESEDPFEAVDS